MELALNHYRDLLCTYYGLSLPQWLAWLHDCLPCRKANSNENDSSQRYLVEDEE